MDRVWHDARGLADLGEAMAAWLEGGVASWPGCFVGPDDETLPLVPVLARLNRRGLVTTMSQPGDAGAMTDGRPWIQRAAARWIHASDPLLPRVIRAARAAGLLVTVHGHGRAVGPSRGVPATRRGSETGITFGGLVSRFQRRAEWRGAGRHARRELARHGVALAVIDPVWGRDTVLWSVLDRA